MTLLVTILLAAGVVLIGSGLDGSSIGDTLHGILAGTLDWSGSTLTTGSSSASGGAAVPARVGEVAQGKAAFLSGYGATASEWPVGDFFGGVIRACVETAGAIAANLSGGVPLSSAGIAGDVKTLQASGQADAGGATNLDAELPLLQSKYGIPSTRYTLPNTQTQAIIQQAIQNNKPVIWGTNNASVLRDLSTGQAYDIGIRGHAITIEGYDDQGVWAADPNTPNPGLMAHYSWSDLLASQGADFAVIG